MSKLKVRYEKRYGMNGNLHKSQTLIVCDGAYECKDILKEMGFRWNSMGRSWEKKTTDESFMTEFAKVVVSCGMTYDDVIDALQFIPESVPSTVDEDAQAAYKEYMDAHPEWF